MDTFPYKGYNSRNRIHSPYLAPKLLQLIVFWLPPKHNFFVHRLDCKFSTFLQLPSELILFSFMNFGSYNLLTDMDLKVHFQFLLIPLPSLFRFFHYFLHICDLVTMVDWFYKLMLFPIEPYFLSYSYCFTISHSPFHILSYFPQFTHQVFPDP